MADTAVTVGKTSPYIQYFQFAKGLAEYRQGRFASTVEWMEKVLTTEERESGFTQHDLDEIPFDLWDSKETEILGIFIDFMRRHSASQRG